MPEYVLELPSSTLGKDELYVFDHLGVIANSIATQLQDQSIRQSVYDAIKDREEASITISELLEIREDLSPSLRQSAQAVNRDFGESLDAFLEVTDYPLQPQIYIPHFDKVQERRSGQSSNLRTSFEEDPVFIIGTGDSGQDEAVYNGYQLDDDGDLYQLAYQIDEGYAFSREVWVISLAEEPVSDSGSSGSGSGETQTNSYQDARIIEMRIKLHKEEWAYGKSEVHIKTIFHNFNVANIEPTPYKLGYENKGDNLRDFTRNDVKEDRTRGIDYYVLNDWDFRIPNSEMDYVSYVIFEYDPWPAPVEEANFSSGGASFITEFRSSNSSYIRATRFKGEFSGLDVITSSIEYSGDYLDTK